MAVTVIAKNNTATDLEIDELGITIPASGQKNLTDQFDYIEIVESDELKTLVSNTDITINNGVIDLNITDGLNHIDIQSVYEDSLEDGGSGSAPTLNLPTLHISRSSSLALTTSFVDIFFENKNIENDDSIIEWDDLNTDRILIKEEGLYNIYFRGTVESNSTTEYSYFRIRKNDSVILNPEECSIRTYQHEIQELSINIPVELNQNDFLTVQGRRGSSTYIDLLISDFVVTKLEGTKGDPGPPGGTTVDIQKDDSTIVSNCAIINFEGSVSVVDNGSNKTTVTIIDEKYIPKIIQLIDSSGNVNVNVNSPTEIDFDTEDYRDVDTFDHSIVSNTSRIYVLKNGLYLCNYKLNIDNSSVSRKTIKAFIRKNGSTNIEKSISYSYSRNTTDDKQVCQANFYIELNSNDYIELLAEREGSSGTARTISNQSILAMELKKEI